MRHVIRCERVAQRVVRPFCDASGPLPRSPQTRPSIRRASMRTRFGASALSLCATIGRFCGH
jgi:hypothetical protein